MRVKEARGNGYAFPLLRRFVGCSVPERQREYQKIIQSGISSALESNELKGAKPILCLLILQLISQFLHPSRSSRFAIRSPNGASLIHVAILSNLSTTNSLQKDFNCSCQRLKCGQGKRESGRLFTLRYSLGTFFCTIGWRSAAILRCARQGDSLMF